MRSVTENVYTFEGLQLGRGYLIDDDGALTLIDTGTASAPAKIVSQIAASGRDPQAIQRILLTHAHADHVGGLPWFLENTQVEVIASAIEAPIIDGTQSPPSPPMMHWPVVGRLMNNGQETPPLLTGMTVHRTVEDGEVLADVMDGLQALVIPGHTAGQTAYWQPERRILFCGDAIMRFWGPLTQPFGFVSPDMAANRRAINRLADLEPAIVCFGHGQPLTKNTAAVMRQFAQKITCAA